MVFNTQSVIMYSLKRINKNYNTINDKDNNESNNNCFIRI